MTFRNIFTSIILVTFLPSVHAGTVTFLDRNEWELALSGSVLVTEDFTDAATNFEANSSNVIGKTTINLVGGVNDPGHTGLTGSGFFQGEVDSTGGDAFALLDSFSFFHAGKISSVSRTSEEFYLDGLITAETPAPVPEPPVIFMLMIGLLSMIAAIRVKRN